MSTVEQLETAVTRLSPEEYAAFRRWLKDYENEMWDQEMAKDADGGHLNALGREALDDLNSGRCTNL